MPTGASRTSRPTASPTRRSRACEAPRRLPDTAPDGPLPPVLRARQGAGGPRRLRAVLPLLRARQRAEARREPLPAGAPRDEHREPEAGLHARVLRGAPAGAPGAATRSSSSACRAPARRCSNRSSPRIRRSRARRSWPNIQRIVLDLQGRDPDLDNPRYPAVLAELPAGGFRCGSASSTSPTRRSTAPASRSSSTRCRTTSGTSASST